MTERDWLSATDSDRMFEFLRGRTTPRKYRLAYCTILRKHWDQSSEDHYNPEHAFDGSLTLSYHSSRRFSTSGMRPRVFARISKLCQKFIDRLADGSVMEAEWNELTQELLSIWSPDLRNILEPLIAPDSELEAAVGQGMERLIGRTGWPTDSYLMRELFGNPFQLVSIDPAWLTSTIISLAKGIQRDGAFERMPILADALQDAGCDNTQLLDHLRGGCLFSRDDVWQPGGSHLPGCWALDLILQGRSPAIPLKPV